MELKTFTFRALSGPVISSPTVTVYLPGTSTLATGLKDASGAALANPFSGSVDGVITFSAPNGIYDLNIVGDGRDYTERVTFQSGAQVVSEAGSSLVATSDSAGRYTVFTSASPKTYSFDSAQSYSIGDEFHVRNSGAGDLTLVAVGSFSFNPPTYGSLVVPQGGTVTIKIVESNRADVLGVTEGDGFPNWMSNPMTTSGDLITGGASGAPGRLGVGSSGQVLKVVDGVPAWAAEGGGASVTTAIPIAVSDETTALTTGTAKVTFRMPFAFTLTSVRASVTTAPTGSVLTVDINEGGTSILSTKLTIDASEKTSTTAAAPAVISDAALADDAEITIDIDTVGSTVAGAGLKVYLIGAPA